MSSDEENDDFPEEAEEENVSEKSEENLSEKSLQKTGVIYIQTVPPNFTVSKMRETLSEFGELGRIFLQAERRGTRGKRRKCYTEGWVEFKSKSAAKNVARMLNGNTVGGKRRSAAFDSLWAMKYLSGFKWAHLMEQLAYERRVEQQRLRAELSQAKRQAEHFAEQVEKGTHIRRLEEKMLKKGGLWERYQHQIQQRQVVKATRQKKSKEVNQSEDFLHMIFDGDKV